MTVITPANITLEWSKEAVINGPDDHIYNVFQMDSYAIKATILNETFIRVLPPGSASRRLHENQQYAEELKGRFVEQYMMGQRVVIEK